MREYPPIRGPVPRRYRPDLPHDCRPRAVYRVLASEAVEEVPQGELARDLRLAMVEAALVAADEPLTAKRLAAAAGLDDAAIAAMRAAHEKMKAAAGDERPDPIARMRRMAEMSMMRAQSLTKVADAAQPLYASLSDDQKWRLRVLMRAIHMHGGLGMGMMRRGGDEGPAHAPHEE